MRIEIGVELETLAHVVAQLQLAFRHPENNGTSRDAAEVFARKVQDNIAEIEPRLGAFLEMGWHSENDDLTEEEVMDEILKRINN